MHTCFDEGHLRAFHDGALPALEAAGVSHHLAECPRCRELLAASCRQTAAASALLGAAPPVDARAAFNQFAAAHLRSSVSDTPQGGSRMSNSRQAGTRRTWIGAIAVVTVLAGLLALPPLRAAADSMLQVFRVQQVVFIPINSDRIKQLNDLNFDRKTLFLAEPKVSGDKTVQTVASAADASSAVGFPVGTPAELPGATTTVSYTVTGAHSAEFQVNVAQARELLRLLDVTDVTIPDALGASPITVDVKPFAITEFTGSNYTLALSQGRSPEVSLPSGVQLSDLGAAMLQVLGTAPDQAKAMAQSIDWNSTLVVPFPSDIRSVREVSVNGSKGMLVATGGRDLPKGEARGQMLYWQNGDQFYVLRSTGSVSDTELVLVAQSIR